MDKLIIQLDFQSSTPLHEQIADLLGEQLAGGRFPQGTRMPTVRLLADLLQVHFNTVARAYRQLEKEGWLSSRPGRGTFAWRTQSNQVNTRDKSLEMLTQEYIQECRELGHTEMDILRELRKQMLPVSPMTHDAIHTK